LIFIQQLSYPSVYDEVVQKLDAELELIPTGSTGCFIEAYAGIDLHSSNNFGIINNVAPRIETGFPLAFLTTHLIFGI
jgi:hypothetical protein